ncbi:MAG: DUF3102 domain-containing protein [Candidatus Thiodiazotropha sp. (ex Dulcina madagascariensis)]|nr:DUF3102 domain-containing protein [Candidatus Thiodiazotropha sp. (ex Dulcina madagascariensis)]
MPSRKTTAPKTPVGPEYPTATPQDLRDEEADARQQIAARELDLAQIDSQFGNDQPFDRDRIVTETRFFLTVISQSILEIGSRLIRLKEHLPHGEFEPALHEIGIKSREAQRMMQATVKFSGAKVKLADLGKTKLLELMVEDDEALEALADGGTLAGVNLDEIDRMSTRELRDTLRKERDTQAKSAETHERLLADKNTKIDALAKQLDTGPVIPDWPQLAERVNVETTTAAGKILLACDQLDALQDQIINGDYEGLAVEETERATEFMAVTYGSALEQARTRVGELYDNYVAALEAYALAYEERAFNISDNQ